MMDTTKSQRIIEAQVESLLAALKPVGDADSFVSGLVISVAIQNISDGAIATIDLAYGNMHSCVYALDVAHKHLMAKVG
jgi:hypothetical protein